MKNWGLHRLFGLALLSLCLGSCSRPILVVQATTNDLQLDFDAYVDNTDDLEIAYDFWSPDGIPFISFLNVTADTILLDLERSQLIHGRKTRVISLEEAIDEQTNATFYKDVYPDLMFRSVDDNMHLVLPPLKWNSIYGPSCHSSQTIKRGEGITFKYVYLKNNITSEVAHTFRLNPINNLRRTEIASYERQNAGPDQYFIDQEVQALGMSSSQLVLDTLLNLLFIFL